MKYPMVGLMLFLTTASVWAGTFRDDFEDGNLDGWRQDFPFAQEPTLWKIVDGKLECTRFSNISTVLITGDATWKDYTIEYDVTLLEDHGPGDVDVVLRWRGAAGYLAIYIGDFGGLPAIYVERNLNIIMQKPFDPLELNKWHHLKVEAKGKNFTFWVNDEKVLEHQDNTIKEGAVGLGLANYTARFDNVEISGPDVPDVTPPTWKARPVQPSDKLAKTWATIKQGR